MSIAALVLFLQGCATLSPAPVAPTIPASLTRPCRPHLQRELVTYGDLALDYSEALAELAECRARHRALADAVTTRGKP